MKNILFTLSFILGLSFIAFSQSPEAFKYQAVIRDGSGNIQANTALGVQLRILQGSPAGASVYKEEFSPSSNAYGIVNLEIGTGTTVDDFSMIDWANGPYYLETAVDLNGGTSYTVLGTSELVSVPYALHAKTAASATETDPVFGASVAAGITNTNINDWNNDLVNDADFDPSNEIQTLSFSNDSLKLTNGGAIDLSGLTPTTYWSRTGNNLTSVDSSTILIGLGTSVITSKLTVRERNTSRVSAVAGFGVNGPTYGQLGAQGDNNHEGDTTLDISGREIGVLGSSIGSSSTDNYGVFGHSNYWGGHFQHFTSGNYVDLGGSSFAMRIVDGNEGSGKVLTSDANGYASWTTPAAAPAAIWLDQGADVIPAGGEDVKSGGDFVAASGNGVINCGGADNAFANVISDAANPTISFATGDEDLYIDDDLEVSSQAYKPGGGSWTTTSDRRLKKNINPYKQGLSELLQVETYTFQYNNEVYPIDSENRTFVGVMAQDMLKIAPQMVAEKEFGRVEVEDENGQVAEVIPGQKFYTFDGSDFTYMTINAVQEQQQQIEDLKKENDALKKQLEALVKRVEALEK